MDWVIFTKLIDRIPFQNQHHKPPLPNRSSQERVQIFLNIERSTSWRFNTHIGEKQWVYRTSFTAPAVEKGSKAVLAFDGLDTFAKLTSPVAVGGESDYESGSEDVSTKVFIANYAIIIKQTEEPNSRVTRRKTIFELSMASCSPVVPGSAWEAARIAYPILRKSLIYLSPTDLY
ncbi:hypothetical protein INS49_014987 [Diaporthe citri]|uniref:uncharacterized protein n=1 Tax=Diaporthe citri TaxID=83186 RepID=UPI001C80BA29|nr:uncharacterized protein INS49_014987 [Diaporthe citri]KAG6357110.1 hypothetical protein INS49_014987 [Diaporthe citri]